MATLRGRIMELMADADMRGRSDETFDAIVG